MFAAIYHILFFIVYKRAFAVLTSALESSVGIRDTKDARRREADNYRKSELCKKVKGLGAVVYVSVAVSGAMMLLSPWFALSWAVRLACAVVAVVCAYNVKSDVCEEAEKIL